MVSLYVTSFERRGAPLLAVYLLDRCLPRVSIFVLLDLIMM